MYRARLPAFSCARFTSHISSIPPPRQGYAACSAAVKDVQQSIASKQRSAREVVQECLERIHAREERLGSFLTVDDQGALKQAQDIDDRVAAGEAPGPLAGVAVAVKDNICTHGLETTAGSQILKGYVPSYDATAVAKLRAAGAIIVGKCNMDEFGMGSSCENSSYQQTRNAWSPDHVPGGSSGGSAAAVAGGQVPVALGSDTGGSVRQPASFNGCVGVKPTYGRVSRSGLIAYASSLDCIGPLTSTVYDAAAVLTAMAGHDVLDATSRQEPVEDFTAGLLGLEQLSSRPLERLRIAVIEETVGSGVNEGVTSAVLSGASHLESLGASVDRVSMGSFSSGLPAYYVIALSEASSNLSRYDGVRYGLRKEVQELRGMYKQTRGVGLGAEVKRRILMGTHTLSSGYYDAYYKKAQQVRTLIRSDFEAALSTYDVLLSPVAPTAAYKFGAKTTDPLSMYLGDLMTVNLNLAGLPAVCLNCGFDESEGVRLPVGMQLIGQAMSEAELLRIAHTFELTNSEARVRPTL